MHSGSRRWDAPKSKLTGGRGNNLRKAHESRRQKNAAAAAAAASSNQTSTPAPTSQASTNATETPKGRSAKKMRHFQHMKPSEVSDDEYFLVHSSALSDLVSTFPCSECESQSLKVTTSERHGFSIKFRIQCSECGFVNQDFYSSKRVNDPK